jgi:flagellar L-ring protein precursor FlgH
MKLLIALVLGSTAFAGGLPLKKKPPQPSALDRYIREAESRKNTEDAARTPGSAWYVSSPMEDLARDLKANRVDDVVTVVVAESASAVATGATKTSRKSSINSSITALAGQKSPTGAAVNLAAMTGDNELDGSGTTSRTTTLTTSLTARVTHVLPNGFLVVEGFKEVQINSEWQTVTVRGIVRPADLGPDNSVVSQRLAQLEVKLDGKGVVNDAIRRPGLLYRLLMGILPF